MPYLPAIFHLLLHPPMRALPALLLLLFAMPALSAQPATIPAFPIEDDDLTLTRLAQPNTYFDKMGHRFGIMGVESGQFEAWAFPLKLFRDFHLSFFIGSSTEPIEAADIVHRIAVRPAATTITYTFQSFTVHAHYITAVDEPGAVILLEVDSTEPISIVAGFIPEMQPMWPAGLGGQYARWDDEMKAYLISESSRKNHGFIGSPAAAGLSYTPAHMLSDQGSQFRINIEDADVVRHRFIPIIMAGGKGDRADIRRVYEHLAADPARLYRETKAYYDSLRTRTLQVTTPAPALNLALEWAKVSYDNLRVSNPDLPGTGLVAGWDRSGRGGRPGFGWFFGGDTYINTFSLNALGHFEAVREALAFMDQFQREDGKMAHEISQATGYIDWFGDYPYAYIHADTSPYYIAAVFDYYRMTGDLAFVRERWPALQRAYAWCRTTDGDGDGLMDNRLAGLGALEFGALTGIQTDIYLGAVWIRATEAMTHLADALQDKTLVEQARKDHERAGAAFEKFWDEANAQYAYAFSEDGERVQEVTPWSSVGLMWGLGTPDRARRTLERIGTSELTTDWGIRMLSDRSAYFEPLNYNYGAVWPFLTSWTATAHFKRDRPLQGFNALMSTVQHVNNRALGHVTEVFSGVQHTWPQESVPHQGFCTAGTVLPFVRGLLGLEGDAPARLLVFEPRIPTHWDSLSVGGYQLGTARFDLAYHRSRDRITVRVIQHGAEAYRLRFAPTLAPGNRVTGVLLNGQPVPFEREETPHVVRPSLQVPLSGTDVLEVTFVPTVEVAPPAWPSQIGDPNRGLKVGSVHADVADLVVTVEGLTGATYRLPLRNADLVATVEGAVLEDSALRITFPPGPPGTFLPLTLRLRTVPTPAR